MGSQRTDAGTVAIVGFAVAVAIYAVAFVAYLSFVETPAGKSKEGPILDLRAEGGLIEALGGSGQSSSLTAGSDWYKDPDKMTRFGLSYDGKPNQLDPDKLKNLTKGKFEKDPANNLLDYEEARLAMGLGDYDFHLRTYPLLNTLDDGGINPVKNLKVAYVGDFDKQTGGGGPYNKPVARTTPTVAAPSGHNVVWVNFTVVNNGTNSAVFQVQLKVPLDDHDAVDLWNTLNLEGNGTIADPYAPGTHQNISLRLHKSTAWEWDVPGDPKVNVVITDNSKTLETFDVSLSGVSMTSGAPSSDRSIIVVDPKTMTFKSSEDPEFTFRIFDGEGDEAGGNNDKVHINVRYVGNHTQVWDWEDWHNSNKKKMPNSLAPGKYNVSIYRVNDPTMKANDTFEVIDMPVGEFISDADTPLIESGGSKYERQLLLDLVESWKNTTYDVNAGDVYPDQKKVMNGPLADNLTSDKYDVLVVGSEIDQNAMTSNAAKDAVKDWVFRGGLLVVLGSVNQQVTWLQPLFSAKLVTSGDGIAVPDTTHPILHVPQELAWESYKDNGKTWEFNNDNDASGFTHVIVRTGGSKPQDVLAVSKPGHFGNGTIILTAWQLFAITSPQQDTEAKSTIYNFLMHALGTLYVDFGPRIPDHAEVATSSRMATAPHPVIPGEKVLVRVVLYVFR